MNLKVCIVLIIGLLPSLIQGQILLELTENDRHALLADSFKKYRIKRIYYKKEIKILWNIDRDVHWPIVERDTFWKKEYVMVSKGYSENGFISYERITKIDGELMYLKTYHFDSSGRLIQTKETDRQYKSLFFYREINYTYNDTLLKRIDRFQWKYRDTIKSSFIVKYDTSWMDRVSLNSDETYGVPYVINHFIYKKRKNIVQEKVYSSIDGEFINSYFYQLDTLGRVLRVTQGKKRYRKHRKPIRVFMYTNSDEIPKTYDFYTKIEKYELKD